MHLSKRIISVLCVITIVISAISPAFAYSATDGFNPVSFWEYVYRGFGGGNRDGGFGGGGFGGSDPNSWTTSDDMKNDYNDFVSTLPATGYDSAGKLLWQPRWIEDTSVWGLRFTDCVSSAYDGYYQSSPQVSVSYLGTEFRFTILKQTPYGTSFFIGSGDVYHSFRAPISGSYTLLSSQVGLGAVLGTNGSTYTFDWNWTKSSLGGVRAGDPVSVKNGWPGTSKNGFYNFYYYVDGYLSLYTPVFEIVPFTTDTTINNTYNINTRVNNFQGDYYDNVTNNYYNNTTIINETTNNYYDMTTNNYYTMSNWSYDYQSRTYFVTLEDGTTITVQFGDDCLTITNNNVENSYQYVINNNNTPSPNPETPAACKHNWTETIDVAPTCLEGGHANFTCSLCGETYEQILSAKGHNWTVKEHVNTVYGESGVIVTQGHTLYECSACGEQWYTETATPPPDVSGGSSIRSWLQAFQLWLDGKLDSLFSAADAPVISRLDAILAELQSAPGSAACEHTYTQHTEQEATCTLPGLLIFTCSQCGDSYSEIVDPLGHDWIVTSHVDAVTDPETGEETASAYDVYTCSRCQRTYEDHDGSGPEEDYSSSSISKLVVKMFSRLGTFAGKLIGSVIHLFDKAITALDNVVSKFNEYVEQISGFGGGYPAWLTGFWGVLPAELQVALTFAVICMALGVVGKKLFFS